MAEYNFLNLPAVHNAAQRSQINEQTRQLNEEKLTAIDEDKRLANTRFLAGSSKVLMDLWEKGEQDGFYAAAEELGPELVRRGIVDEEAWLQNKDKIGYDSVKQRYAQAMTALAGRPIVEAKPGDNVGKTWVNPDTGTMWGMRRSGQSFDTGVAAQQYAMKTVTVPLSDGTEMMVNYNPASGEGYDMQTGQTYIVRPGGGGEALVYGEEGLIGAGQSEAPQQQSQAPAGFGRTEDPAQQKRRVKEAEVGVTEEIKQQKIVDSQLTSIENAYRLMPMMQAARTGADAWNTGWGSMLAAFPATSARDLQATITTIKGNIGFDRLQRMRAESPTGGALGQVAVQELEALQSTIASLDQAQSTDQFKTQMQTVLQQYHSWTRAWGEAIMKEGTDDQRRKYYSTVPEGQQYVDPNGVWRVKRARQ